MWNYICYTLFSKCSMHQVSTTLVADSTDGEHPAFKVGGGSWGLQVPACFLAAFRDFWVMFDTALNKIIGDCI